MMLLGEIERSVQAAEDRGTESANTQGVLRFITAGSVDDGKSTLIGRLLHDARAIFEDQLAAVTRASSRRGQEDVDLSLLTDASKASRSTSRTAISRRPGASSSSPTRPATSSTRATW